MKDSFIDEQELQEFEDVKYLIFRLESDVYATPLLGVKQVIEAQPIKKIPNTVPYFIGLINYRGQVLGLLDLRLRFGYDTNSNSKGNLLIFDSDTGPIATIVSKVDAVVSIADAKIERRPNIKSRIPSDYLLGVGDYKGEILTIIDLNRAFTAEDFVEIKSTKMRVGA